MNNGLMNDDWLDDLLAQPPRLSDNGFIGRLKARIGHREKQRKWIFLGMASLWLVILLLAFPSGFFSENLQQAITLNSRSEQLVQSLLALDLPALLKQSVSVSTVSVILLGFYALIALLLNNR